MRETRHAVQFARVSSKDQRDGFSLDAQLSLGSAYAEKTGLKLVREPWAVDESASKEKDRKRFLEMLSYVRENSVTHVIFDKIDRACRGYESALLIQDMIERHGVRFHFVRDNLVIDKDSAPSERLRLDLGILLGKHYIDNLKSEIRKGMDARAAQGYWNHKAPFGYQNTRERGRAEVVPHPKYAPIVREVFERYSTGNYTLRQLSEYIRERVPGKVVTKRIIESLLANPFYHGVIRSRATEKIGKGQHEPLVSKELWDHCQRVRGIRASKRAHVHEEFAPKPFMGMIRCAACGRAITGETKQKASGKRYVYYHCANPDCAERPHYVSQGDLFEQLETAFEPFNRFTPEALKAFVTSLGEHFDDVDLYLKQRQGEIAQARLEIKKKLEQLETLHAEGVLSDAEYEEVLTIRKKALEEVDQEASAAHDADGELMRQGIGVIELLQKAHSFMNRANNTDFGIQQAQLAKLVLSNRVLGGGTLRYDYEKPFDSLLEMSGNEEWWRRGESNPRPRGFSDQLLRA